MDETIRRQVVLDALDEIETEVAEGRGFQYSKWRQYFAELPSEQSSISVENENDLQQSCNKVATDDINIQEPDVIYSHCEDCIHTGDSEDICILRLCKYAIAELKDCYEPKQAEQRWIPFKTRPLTEEEKEEHPEWDCILDCKLPDNGQRILVAIRIRGHEEVQQDEFYSDDGSYLDSGYEIGTEAVAWMPLPEPYRGDDHETD